MKKNLLTTIVAFAAIISAARGASVQGVLSANGPFCVSGTGQLTWTATAGTGPYTVVYYDGTANRTVTNVVSGTPFNAFTNPVTSTTTYTLVMVIDANNDTISTGFTGGTATIAVNPLPNPGFTGNDTACGSVVLTAGGGSSYAWSGGSSITTATDTFSSSGTYTVTVTNGNNCSASASKVVLVNTAPTVNPVSNQTVCAGGTIAGVSFSGSINGTIYNWTNSNPAIGLAASGTGNIASFNAINNGTVPVTATITATPVLSGAAANAYIANAYSSNLSVISTTTNTVIATINLEDDPYGVAVSPDGSKVYVTNQSSNAVSVINTATNTVTATIPVQDQPVGIVVSPDGGKVYVANVFQPSVSVIDAATNTVINTITGVGGTTPGPLGITITPDGSEVFTADQEGLEVTVISTATNSIITNITGLLTGGESGLAVTPNGQYLYVADQVGDSVAVIKISNNTEITRIPVGSEPSGVAISPDGSTVYVTNWGTDYVSVISTATNTVTGTITVGTGPLGVSVSADGNKVYVSNEGSGTVSAINAATNTVTNTITVGTGPFSLGNFLTGTVGCTGTPTTFTITVNPSAAAGITGATSGCGPVSLTATGGTAYAWSGGNSPNTAADTFASSGTYTVSVTNSYSCSATVSGLVTVSALVAGINGTATGCGPVSLTATGGTSYAWSGGTTPNMAANSFTSTGTYTVTVSNGVNCSNTASQTVTINPAAFSQFSRAICSGQSFIYNNQTLTQSGAYNDTLQTVQGCDSVVTLNLAVNSMLPTTIRDSICNGSSFAFNGHSLSQAGVYYDTLQGTAGCDSIVMLNLSIKTLSGDSVRATAAQPDFCSGDSAEVCATPGFASYYWSNEDSTACFYTPYAGSYSVTVTDISGCTALSNSVTLSIYNPTPVTISVSGDTLTSFGAKAYQWYFNHQPLPGDTGNRIIAMHSGNYTVEITDSNGCHYTSSIEPVNTAIAGMIPACGVKLYPNPNTGKFTLEFADDVAGEVEITDAMGQTIIGSTKIQKQQNFELEILAAGIYLLRINEDGAVENLRFSVVK